MSFVVIFNVVAIPRLSGSLRRWPILDSSFAFGVNFLIPGQKMCPTTYYFLHPKLLTNKWGIAYTAITRSLSALAIQLDVARLTTTWRTDVDFSFLSRRRSFKSFISKVINFQVCQFVFLVFDVIYLMWEPAITKLFVHDLNTTDQTHSIFKHTLVGPNFMKVGLLSTFKLLKLWVILNCNILALSFVSVIPHVRWCTLESQPIMSCYLSYGRYVDPIRIYIYSFTDRWLWISLGCPRFCWDHSQDQKFSCINLEFLYESNI